MGHVSVSLACRMVAVAAAVCIVGSDAGWAQPAGDGPRGQSGPVYQRRAFDWKKHDDFRHHDNFRHKDNRFFHQRFEPNVQSRWFQRPYPYHLDFYKMKYGGSYAPYFGNLYGPPQVVTAPPYYGPYYGGWGFENGGWGAGAEGYPPGAFGGAPWGQPAAPGDVVEEEPAVESNSNHSSATQSNGERLPAPRP